MAKTLAFLRLRFPLDHVGNRGVFAPEAIDAFWESVRGLPWWLEGPIWFLTLPWMIGLWVWQSSWDLWLRFVLVVGVALANLVSFNPWTQSQKTFHAGPACYTTDRINPDRASPAGEPPARIRPDEGLTIGVGH